MSIKINSLQVENVKRVKAVQLEPTKSGLTIIGGKNRQGKTSFLDAICWGLGGDKFKPSEAKREESVTDPFLHIELSNGFVVERQGKNSSLKVIDANGNKGGQQLLNEFISTLALDLPKFMSANGKEKAETLLKTIGVGDKLSEIESEIQRTFNQRTEIGRIADQKQKYADEMVSYPEAPKETISVSELIKAHQAILVKNGENKKKRENVEKLIAKEILMQDVIDRLKCELEKAQEEMKQVKLDLDIGQRSCSTLQDESTAELEENLQNIEKINAKVASNINKDRAEKEAAELKGQYDDLTEKIEERRKAKTDLLNSADLPLPELSVEDGELIYKKAKWDCMSGADQLKVATAIVRKINPECGFVLMDGLEAMDSDTLAEFGAYLEKENLQVIATRVSTNKDECSIIIEDGYIKEEKEAIQPMKPWQGGKL